MVGWQGSAARTARTTRLHCCASTTTAVAPRQCLKVSFKIPYRVAFGQSVGLLGSHESLGSWDCGKAVKMTWNSGDYWQVEVEVPPGSAPPDLEYKYVVINSNGQISHWKPGRNYKLDVASAAAQGGSRVVVNETWDDGPRSIEIDKDAAAAAAAAAQQHANGSAMNGRARSQSPPPASSGEFVRGASRPRSSSVSLIEFQADAAMAELKQVLDRQVESLQRLADPTDRELLLGDRLLAAANLKAVALNRALRAARALPHLPSPTATIAASHIDHQ